MRFSLILFLLLIHLKCSFAQKVTNITAEQVGQSIQVSYCLESELPCSVSLYYSTNNGVIWQGPLQKASGDVGDKIMSGNKKIMWDVLSEVEQLDISDFKFKVTANISEVEEVIIGDQIGSGKNLSVANFRNGDKIYEAKSILEWVNAYKLKKPAWCYYDFDDTLGHNFGKLYNYYAVNDCRGLAPIGWEVPTAMQVIKMEKFLQGIDSVFEEGLQIKSTDDWPPSVWQNGKGKNYHGFNALPGGGINSNGFGDIGRGCLWWTINPNSIFVASNEFFDDALKRDFDLKDEIDSIFAPGLSDNLDRIFYERPNISNNNGMYVRCIKSKFNNREKVARETFMKNLNKFHIDSISSYSYPNLADIQEVFTNEFAFKYYSYLKKKKSNTISYNLNKRYLDVKVEMFTTDDLRNYIGNYQYEMRKVTKFVKDNVEFYKVSYLNSKDAVSGLSYCYWVLINGKWCYFPEPWKALEE
jgi:uncharacterized protein (TIGR02145 family)